MIKEIQFKQYKKLKNITLSFKEGISNYICNTKDYTVDLQAIINENEDFTYGRNISY